MAVLCISSCKKETESVDRHTAKPKSSGLALSPGEIHNLVLQDYIDRYGLEHDDETTFDEARTLCLHIAELSAAAGFTGNLSPAEMTGRVMQNSMDAGFFENGILKSPDEINALCIQQIENPSIRTALLQISALADQGSADFRQESGQILSQLAHLTPDERKMMDGFGSVLDHSLVLWSGKPSLEALVIKLKVALSDALGYIQGYNYSIKTGDSQETATQFALSEAKFYSARTAKKLGA